MHCITESGGTGVRRWPSTSAAICMLCSMPVESCMRMRACTIERLLSMVVQLFKLSVRSAPCMHMPRHKSPRFGILPDSDHPFRGALLGRPVKTGYCLSCSCQRV